VTPFRGRKVKVTRPINAETENTPYLPKGRRTNFKLGTAMKYDDRHAPTSAVTSQVKHQGQRSKVNVTTSRHQSDAFAHNSTAKSRRNTKIGMKVVRATADIPHHFQGQKIKGQGHQAALGAVQVTTSRGRGHIVAAAQQTNTRCAISTRKKQGLVKVGSNSVANKTGVTTLK